MCSIDSRLELVGASLWVVKYEILSFDLFETNLKYFEDYVKQFVYLGRIFAKK